MTHITSVKPSRKSNYGALVAAAAATAIVIMSAAQHSPAVVLANAQFDFPDFGDFTFPPQLSISVQTPGTGGETVDTGATMTMPTGGLTMITFPDTTTLDPNAPPQVTDEHGHAPSYHNTNDDTPTTTTMAAAATTTTLRPTTTTPSEAPTNGSPVTVTDQNPTAPPSTLSETSAAPTNPALTSEVSSVTDANVSTTVKPPHHTTIYANGASAVKNTLVVGAIAAVLSALCMM